MFTMVFMWTILCVNYGTWLGTCPAWTHDSEALVRVFAWPV